MSTWLQTYPGLTFGIAALGLCLGSFLNVVIYRWPLGISVVRPRSRCPRCEQMIHAWDNIPVLSYLFLRGRCRHCGAPISLRYPLVELLGGAALVGAALVSASPAAAAVRAVFLLAMIAVFFIDLDHRLIPDEISLGGIVAGILVSPLIGVPRLESLIGIAVGAGGFFLIALFYRRLRGITGMGGGDIKLAGTLGAFLGWKGVLLTILLGSFAGSAVGVGMIAAGKGNGKMALPFGTFLAAAGALVILFGARFWDWYLRVTVPGAP